MSAAIAKFFQLSMFDPERIVTSPWMRPQPLAWIRATLGLYCVITAIISYSHATGFQEMFRHFTSLTYLGVVLYYLSACTWTVFYFRQPPHLRRPWILSKPRILGYLTWIQYDMIIVYNLMVPPIYWSILAKGKPPMGRLEWFLNISQHGLEGVFCLLEICISGYHLAFSHILIVAFVMGLYLALTFVDHALEHTWVYSFEVKSNAYIYYIAMGIAVLMLYTLNWWIHRWKEGCYMAKMKNEGLENEKNGNDLNDAQLEEY